MPDPLSTVQKPTENRPAGLGLPLAGRLSDVLLDHLSRCRQDWTVMPRFVGEELVRMGLVEVYHAAVHCSFDKGAITTEARWRLTRKGHFALAGAGHKRRTP